MAPGERPGSRYTIGEVPREVGDMGIDARTKALSPARFSSISALNWLLCRYLLMNDGTNRPSLPSQRLHLLLLSLLLGVAMLGVQVPCTAGGSMRVATGAGYWLFLPEELVSRGTYKVWHLAGKVGHRMYLTEGDIEFGTLTRFPAPLFSNL